MIRTTKILYYSSRKERSFYYRNDTLNPNTTSNVVFHKRNNTSDVKSLQLIINHSINNTLNKKYKKSKRVINQKERKKENQI